MIFVIGVELRDVANLATEGWSSEAAENEYKRPSCRSFSNMKAGGAIESDQPGIGRLIANPYFAKAHVRKGVTHHVQRVFRATGHDTEERAGAHEKHGEADQSPFEGDGHRGISDFPREVLHALFCNAPRTFQ
jgi:hypothetical protein